jgi:hypothetical protein
MYYYSHTTPHHNLGLEFRQALEFVQRQGALPGVGKTEPSRGLEMVFGFGACFPAGDFSSAGPWSGVAGLLRARRMGGTKTKTTKATTTGATAGAAALFLLLLLLLVVVIARFVAYEHIIIIHPRCLLHRTESRKKWKWKRKREWCNEVECLLLRAAVVRGLVSGFFARAVLCRARQRVLCVWPASVSGRGRRPLVPFRVRGGDRERRGGDARAELESTPVSRHQSPCQFSAVPCHIFAQAWRWAPRGFVGVAPLLRLECSRLWGKRRRRR